MSKKKKKKKVKLSPAREAFLEKMEIAHEFQQKVRSPAELWFDKHNHKMEFLRTLFALLTIGLQVVILCKLFNVI